MKIKGGIRNYQKEAYNNTMAQTKALIYVDFWVSEYQELDIPSNSVIYCDPPYKGTIEYAKQGFDSNKFFQWCRDMTKQGHKVYISEYNAPEYFICLWEKEVSSSLRANGIIKGDKKPVERLFTL